MLVDLIKLVKVAYTPLRTQTTGKRRGASSSTRTNAPEARCHGGRSVQLLSSGSWLASKGCVTTPRMAREMRKKVLSHDFTPEKVR